MRLKLIVGLLLAAAVLAVAGVAVAAGAKIVTLTGVYIGGACTGDSTCVEEYIATGNGTLVAVSAKVNPTRVQLGSRVTVHGTMYPQEYESLPTLNQAKVLKTAKGPPSFRVRGYLGAPQYPQPGSYGLWGVGGGGQMMGGTLNNTASALVDVKVPASLHAAAKLATRSRKPLTMTLAFVPSDFSFRLVAFR